MFLRSGQPEDIAHAAATLRRSPGDAVGVFLAHATAPNLDHLVAALRATGVPFFGGVFPQLIHRGRLQPEGALLVPIALVAPPVLVRGLDRDEPEIPHFDPRLFASAARRCTALVLVDGLTGGIRALTSGLFDQLGTSMRFLGGGAGGLPPGRAPCVFTAEGAFEDAGIVAFVPRSCHIAVRHGYSELAGPLVATRTRGNTILSLNWRNAFEVYREAVEADAGRPLTPDTFAALAPTYPFGMQKADAENVVRDPFAVGAAGEIVCVGDVPENAVLSILKGSTESLVQAAAEAGRECAAAAGKEGGVVHAFLVDCVSRALFLGEGFARELEAVSAALGELPAPLATVGVLSLGEIASGEGLLEFYNKTIVLGLFHGR